MASNGQSWDMKSWARSLWVSHTSAGSPGLGHHTLLSQATSRQLHGKWGIWYTNQRSYGMPALAGRRLACWATALAPKLWVNLVNLQDLYSPTFSYVKSSHCKDRMNWDLRSEWCNCPTCMTGEIRKHLSFHVNPPKYFRDNCTLERGAVSVSSGSRCPRWPMAPRQQKQHIGSLWLPLGSNPQTFFPESALQWFSDSLAWSTRREVRVNAAKSCAVCERTEDKIIQNNETQWKEQVIDKRKKITWQLSFSLVCGYRFTQLCQKVLT